jgi:hypothetical protein
MSRYFCGVSAIGTLSFLLASTAWAQEDMVPNPFYKFWSSSKPGATAVLVEHTKLTGPEGKLVPSGIDEKRIAYKLLEVNPERAVVEMLVTEKDFLGYIQAAPTRYIYPAKVKKSDLERILLADGGKAGEEVIKVGGKDMKCKTFSGTIKEPGGEQVEFKLWLSNDVPGSIVKHVRTARQKGETIAETTTTLKSYKKAK